jgi:hypothetical protein
MSSGPPGDVARRINRIDAGFVQPGSARLPGCWQTGQAHETGSPAGLMTGSSVESRFRTRLEQTDTVQRRGARRDQPPVPLVGFVTSAGAPESFGDTTAMRVPVNEPEPTEFMTVPSDCMKSTTNRAVK